MPAAAAIYYADGAIDAARTRAALSQVKAPVLVMVGGQDFQPTIDAGVELARLFPEATVVEQERSGHYPWVDDPGAFVAKLSVFLGLSSGDRLGPTSRIFHQPRTPRLDGP